MSSSMAGTTSLSRKPKYSKFTQQELPACKPVWTPGCAILSFLIVGAIFIPIGIGARIASQSVVEIVDQYETECIPMEFQSNKLQYIKSDFIPKKCVRILRVPKVMKAPIFVYYQLENFYQNHRRYIKSRSDRQLTHGLDVSNIKADCAPVDHSNGLPILPCGLIAWSLFNDTYKFFLETTELPVNRKNIAWKSDRETRFGKNVYPFNFQNGSLIGGAKLDPSIPLSEQEDLIVWMRTAALPTFRKLYGRIEEDLQANEYITVTVQNNYNVYSFGGKKSLVLSTTSLLGGKNDSLGNMYFILGVSSIIVALFFFIWHIRHPRPTYFPQSY